MSRPLITLLYQHGRFGPADTVATANALVMYCVGLPAFAAVGVLTRCFYALGDTRTPMQASLVSVAVNVVLNLLLMRPLAHLGLAFATSVTSIVNLLQLALYLRRRLGLLEGRRILKTLLRVTAAGAAVAILCALGVAALGPRAHAGFLMEALVVGAAIVLGAAVAFAVMKILRVEELAAFEDLLRSLTARFGGRPPSS
jgi:putative peptidoglycan lipid II flippase